MGDVDAYQEAEEQAAQLAEEQAQAQREAAQADLTAEPVRATASHGRSTAELPLGLIQTAANMRTGELPDIQGLAISIREVGLISPLLVRANPDNTYRLIAGRRRLAALTLVHDHDAAALIHCEVIASDLDEAQAWVLMLTENLQREDPPPLQVARGLRAALHLDPSLSASALARSLGKSPAWASRHLHLLDLPESVQERLDAGDLNFTIADLIRQGEKKGIIADNEDADRIAEGMISGDMSVDELKKLVRPAPTFHVAPENYEQISQELDAARRGTSERGFEPSEVDAAQRDWEADGASESAQTSTISKQAPTTEAVTRESFGHRQLDAYLIGRLLREHASTQLLDHLQTSPEAAYEFAWGLGDSEDRQRIQREIAVDLMDADDELPPVIFSAVPHSPQQS
jgi:ParB/RepB/Spo0J family partition protein